MTVRVSIEAPGSTHANPIPAACRIGPFVFTGALTGRDPATGEMPASLDEQVRHVFLRIVEVLAAAGETTDAVAKVTVHLVDYRDRDALNREWLAMFPDAASRPARQVLAAQLDGGALVHADLVAVSPGAWS